MANKYMIRCITLQVIKEMKMTTTMKYYFIISKMAKIKKTENTKHQQECGTTGFSWKYKIRHPLQRFNTYMPDDHAVLLLYIPTEQQKKYVCALEDPNESVPSNTVHDS